MLALSRKVGESVAIGDPKNPIGWVKVTEIRKGAAAVLAFDFPKDVAVHRGEVVDRIVAGATEVPAREVRPSVRIKDGPSGLIQERRIRGKELAVLDYFYGLEYPIAPGNFWKAIEEKRLGRAAVVTLTEWGLLEVLADQSVRLSQLGEQAAREYARWRG